MRKIIDILKEQADIIIFIVVMLCANWLWKLCIDGEEATGIVYFLGLDVSSFFHFFAKTLTREVYAIMHHFLPALVMSSDVKLSFTDSSYGSHTAWTCTAVKQSFIWICIIIFSRGSWKHKLWYIPLGILCFHIINIIRLCILTYIVGYQHELFDLFHLYILKYMFYFLMFLIWVLWNEKFGTRYEKL
ncbi:MAG: exosortase/archaeosortase family protein [Paludibacteraceae bacterium]|nr:exosortase/archaeosortase family protein [Paludibacteraceae bacterium]